MCCSFKPSIQHLGLSVTESGYCSNDSIKWFANTGILNRSTFQQIPKSEIAVDDVF